MPSIVDKSGVDEYYQKLQEWADKYGGNAPIERKLEGRQTYAGMEDPDTYFKIQRGQMENFRGFSPEELEKLWRLYHLFAGGGRVAERDESERQAVSREIADDPRMRAWEF